MLEVHNLECVRGDHQLFEGLEFKLQAGELLYLKGSNGSGKTSLLRTLCGLMLPEQGEIRWNGENIREVRDEFNEQLTYLGHHNGIKGELSAIENLELGGAMAGVHVAEDDILDALKKIGLAGREDLPSKVLSQGQKRRVALSRLLLSKTRLWVLDEPFTALDVKAVAMLAGLIREHLHQGGMAILTTHQEVDIDASATRELNLDTHASYQKGKVVL